MSSSSSSPSTGRMDVARKRSGSDDIIASVRRDVRTLVHTHRNMQLSPGGVASLKVYTNKNVPTDGLDVGAVEVEVELGRRVPCLCTAVREPLPRAWVSLKKRSWLGTLARAIKR